MTRVRHVKAAGRRASVPATSNCAVVFQNIALDCVALLKANLEGAAAGDPEAVRQMRVALTRLRAAVSFFAPMTVGAEWRRLKREIRWLNARLGAARDSEVMVEHSRRRRYRAWAVFAIGGDLDRRWKQDHRRLTRCLRSIRARRLPKALSVWTMEGAWLQRWQAAARRGKTETPQVYCERRLDCWRERLIRNGRHLSSLNGARRHRLRIRAKRFRYMLEALTDIGAISGRTGRRQMHEAAKGLQRNLGDMRDLKRFADLRRDGRRPPGYRRERNRLASAATSAWRELKHVVMR